MSPGLPGVVGQFEDGMGVDLDDIQHVAENFNWSSSIARLGGVQLPHLVHPVFTFLSGIIEKNYPRFPGTILAEVCLQVMHSGQDAFTILACFTLNERSKAFPLVLYPLVVEWSFRDRFVNSAGSSWRFALTVPTRVVFSASNLRERR